MIRPEHNLTGVISVTGTVYLPVHMSSHPVLMGFVLLNLVFCVVFCRLLFVSLSIFIWLLYFLSFDLRHLITLCGITKLFVT
jgi:hypothetical protein